LNVVIRSRAEIVLRLRRRIRLLLKSGVLLFLLPHDVVPVHAPVDGV
jgi:hypothetical protein